MKPNINEALIVGLRYRSAQPTSFVDPLGLETSYGMKLYPDEYRNLPFNPSGFDEGVYRAYGCFDPIDAGLMALGIGTSEFAIARLLAIGARAGKVASAVDDLLRAGNLPDKNALTRAGRELQKHGDRTGSAFPKSSGTAAERNQQGQNVLEKILRSENQTVKQNRMGGKDFIDNNTGQGVRFDGNGKMYSFLEP